VKINLFKYINIGILLLSSFLSKAQDSFPPDAPIIDSVSVQSESPSNPNGDVYIHWQASDSTDVRSYYIFYWNKSVSLYALLDSVDANTTEYLDTKTITNPKTSQQYVIQAVDSANNKSVLSQAHQTITLSTQQEIRNCKKYATISWNKYEKWTEGIDAYDLFFEKDNKIINTVHIDANTLEYTYLLNNEDEIYFYIRAYSKSGKSSTSYKLLFKPKLLNKPKTFKLEYVTVEDERIKMLFLLDKTSDSKNYKLFRSVNSVNNFQYVKTFEHYDSDSLECADDSSDVTKNQYYYKLVLFDDCDNLIESSNIGSTILLYSIFDNKKYDEKLSWSHYAQWEKGVEKYILERISHLNDTDIIDDTPGGFAFIDRLEKNDPSVFSGKISYRITAIKKGSKGKTKSHSNIINIEPPSIITVPNAFSPYGAIGNRVFKPLHAFILEKDYYFAIYDRWGQLIFETTDTNKGWDGKKNGQVCPNNVYYYYIQYYSLENEKNTKAGTLNLIY